MTILRYLANPNVPDREKIAVREMLLMLADRARERAAATAAAKGDTE